MWMLLLLVSTSCTVVTTNAHYWLLLLERGQLGSYFLSFTCCSAVLWFFSRTGFGFLFNWLGSLWSFRFFSLFHLLRLIITDRFCFTCRWGWFVLFLFLYLSLLCWWWRRRRWFGWLFVGLFGRLFRRKCRQLGCIGGLLLLSCSFGELAEEVICSSMARA